MAEKDITQKILFDIKEVFADIINGIVFKGRQVILPEELENAQTESQLKIADGIHEQERDVAKRWLKHGVTISLIGLENQTGTDCDMPFRVIGYDGASYKEQAVRRAAARRHKEPVPPFYPVLTLVLYFGPERWSGPKTLRECLPKGIPPEIKALISDYPIYVVEVAFFTDEELSRFKSDFRFLAEFARYNRTGEKEFSNEEVIYAEELLKALKAFLSKEDYPLIEQIFTKTSEGGGTMKGKFSEAIWESFGKGKEEGRIEGRIEGAIEIIIQDCKEEHKTLADAVNKIVRRLSMQADEAEQLARQYWGR